MTTTHLRQLATLGAVLAPLPPMVILDKHCPCPVELRGLRGGVARFMTVEACEAWLDKQRAAERAPTEEE